MNNFELYFNVVYFSIIFGVSGYYIVKWIRLYVKINRDYENATENNVLYSKER